MGKLIYAITTSLDGYVADAQGNFDWAMPSEQVHLLFNDIVRNVCTCLFGRNMYETMKVWDTIATDGDSPAMNEYALLWKSTRKIVYSTTLTHVDMANATIEPNFNTGAVQKLVAASDEDYAIGGPHLAAAAIRAGIVDDYHQIIAPVLVGSGNHWLPDDVTTQLELVNVTSFKNGFVHLHYRRV